MTPVTDTISLDEEISKFMEMGSFGQQINSVNLPSSSLNTPTLPMLSPDPPTLTTSPPPEIFQPTFTQESALEPLDLSVTIANSTESPISPPPTVTQTSTPQSDQKGYLAALMDSHQDRALSSSNMVKVVSSEHTMETVEALSTFVWLLFLRDIKVPIYVLNNKTTKQTNSNLIIQCISMLL